jgi:hypothetical protein
VSEQEKGNNGSESPARQRCATCYSFDSGHCNRINAEVEKWWTGCMLHVPKADYRNSDES